MVVRNYRYGFTIVELLIVVVVISILASITIVAYNGIQDRSRQSKMSSDIAAMTRAIVAARVNNSSSLRYITNSSSTGGNCWSKPNGTDLGALPDTDSCIIAYNAALDAISVAAGADIRGIRDPWNRPYLIDENENEAGPAYCVKDSLTAFKYPFTTGFGNYSTTPLNKIPIGGFNGCQ